MSSEGKYEAGRVRWWQKEGKIKTKDKYLVSDFPISVYVEGVSGRRYDWEILTDWSTLGDEMRVTGGSGMNWDNRSDVAKKARKVRKAMVDELNGKNQN
jgi:hypothetical protein